MDHYHQVNQAPPSSGGSSTNYVVQLDPNSGNFELVDSSYQDSRMDAATAMMSMDSGIGIGGVQGLVMSGTGVVAGHHQQQLHHQTEETVYKIRDDEFCLNTGGRSIVEQAFDQIDIDPATMQEMYQQQQHHQQQDASSSSGVHVMQNLVQVPQQTMQYQQQQTPQIQYQQQQQQVYVTLDDHQHNSGGNNNIMGTEQIYAQQQQQQLQQQQQTTTSSDGGEHLQLSAPMMSLLQGLIAPGAQAFQMDNNLIICNPGGQVIQVPLPSQQSSSSSTNNNYSTPIQQQQTPQVQLNHQQNYSTVQIQETMQVPAENYHQQQQQVSYVSRPTSIPTQAISAPVPVIMEVPKSATAIHRYQEHQKIQSESKSLTSTPHQTPSNKTEIVTVEGDEEDDGAEEVEVLGEIIEQDIQDEDDFDIKIVSCYSTAKEHSSSADQEKPPEKGEEEVAKPNKPIPNLIRIKPAKKKFRLEPFIPKMEGRTPHIPPWLQSYVDDDDELLIAFKNRVDKMKTDICQFCYTWFYSPKELREHIKMEHVGKAKFHHCKICEAKFPARVLRLRHEKLHKYDLKYRPIVYLNNPNMKYHYRKRFRPARFSPWYESHVKKVCDKLQKLPYECFDCGRKYSSSDTLSEHYNRYHAMQVCGFCGNSFQNLKSLKQHEEDKHGHYTITNNYLGGAWNLWDHWMCEESIKKDLILSNIAYFHNYCNPPKDAPKLYEEDFVEVTFEDEEEEKDCEFPEGEDEFEVYDEEFEDDLTEESQTTRNSIDDKDLPRLPYACEECSKSYDNEHDLRRHARCHIGQKQSACQYCGKNFKTQSHKKEHERTHTGEKPYICNVCQRSFIQSSNLKKHMLTHKCNSSLQCGVCGKQFIKDASLLLHQRAHAKDRKFRCTICDRAYNYASLLKRHMRIHTGEMPYSCESCGMLFHELVSLHYHRKKVHTGERPHKCDICGRAFILSSDLKKHVQIHSKTNEMGRPIINKPLRKRSQSKSTENLENFPHIKRTKLSRNSFDTDSQKFDKSFDEEDEEVDDGVSMRSQTSPCSSLENEIISNTKAPVIRVYSRRDTKVFNHEQNDASEGIGNNYNIITSSTPQYISSTHQPVFAVKSKVSSVDQNSTKMTSYTMHPPVSYQVSSSQATQITRLATTNPVGSFVSPQGSIVISSQDDGRMPQMSNTEYQNQMFANAVEFSSNHQLTGSAGDHKSIEEVLQLSGSFNDFDMSNIIVVPEASSEVEIILDGNNRTMR